MVFRWSFLKASHQSRNERFLNSWKNQKICFCHFFRLVLTNIRPSSIQSLRGMAGVFWTPASSTEPDMTDVSESIFISHKTYWNRELEVPAGLQLLTADTASSAGTLIYALNQTWMSRGPSLFTSPKVHPTFTEPAGRDWTGPFTHRLCKSRL